MGFYLFGAFIPYYGFLILMGLVCASILGYFLCKKLSLDIDDFIIICAYLIAFGFAGAKLLYIAVSYKNIDFHSVFSSLENFNSFFNSGFVFYGGLIGGVFALLFVKKIHKVQTREYTKILAPCLALVHAFGRVGCSLVGCCYGKETNNKIFFEYSESMFAPNGVHLFPVQGIESLFLFCLCAVLIFLLLKDNKTNTSVIYIVFYSTVRFVLEFFRGDEERGFFEFLSTSQVISLFFLITSLTYIIIKKLTEFRTKK